jgi:ribosomal protein L11 methyltransferase
VSWTSLRISGTTDRQAVIAALFEAGAQGVHEDGDAVITHFPDGSDLAAIVAAVRGIAPAAACEISPTPDIDWSEAWRDRLLTYAVGALTVSPPWLAKGLDPARTVVIDPGMAFGTGDHASTRGVLRLMQRVLEPGLVVADLGAGSAVLSIAAARLGASRVFAIELDADALGNAQENIERNGVGDVVHLFEGDAEVLLPLVAPVDLIVANIISSVLVELLPAMARALPSGGCAVLGGMLREEEPVILEIVAADGWRVVEDETEEDWWSLTITRP